MFGFILHKNDPFTAPKPVRRISVRALGLAKFVRVNTKANGGA